MEIGRASIHFVNLSIVTSRWVKPSGRLFEWPNQVEPLDHEERHVASGLARSCPQALKHRQELGDPTCTKLVQPIEDLRLEAL